MEDKIKRFKKLASYKLNEANYTIIDDLSEDDEAPSEIYGDNSPMNLSIDEDEEEGAEDQELEMPEAGIDPEATDDSLESEEEIEPETVSSEINNEKDVNSIQNDIIKMNTSALDKMNQEIDKLYQTIDNLNKEMSGFKKEVDNVKEPSDQEKFQERKQDSYPYYFSLNDTWKGSYFDTKSQENPDEYGIKKLEDGTYVANFDDLPKYTEQEILDSLN